MILIWHTILVLGVLVLAVTPVIAQPTPFLVSGRVDYNSAVPVNNPDVTVVNLNTSEVFTSETTAGSSHYQVATSPYNMSVGDLLQLRASDGYSGTLINHSVTHSVTQHDIDTGGFEQNFTILVTTPSQRICGDVNDDESVDMTDVMTLWYDIADYPTPGAYTISNAWAADVNCNGSINMTDVMTLWYDIADYPTPGAYEVECCTIICGDVDDDGEVGMMDAVMLWYAIADYPYPGAFMISNEWAADVNCDGELDMTDVVTIWYDIADYPAPGVYEVNCCGG